MILFLGIQISSQKYYISISVYDSILNLSPRISTTSHFTQYYSYVLNLCLLYLAVQGKKVVLHNFLHDYRCCTNSRTWFDHTTLKMAFFWVPKPTYLSSTISTTGSVPRILLLVVLRIRFSLVLSFLLLRNLISKLMILLFYVSDSTQNSEP